MVSDDVTLPRKVKVVTQFYSNVYDKCAL